MSDKTWYLISFDADSCFHNGCRPLTGIAKFVGFENEEEIVRFILNDPKCTTLDVILECMAWYDGLYEQFDDKFTQIMKKRFSSLDFNQKIKRILDLFEQTWKKGCSDSMVLARKNEKLFTVLRSMNRTVWEGGCKKYVKH